MEKAPAIEQTQPARILDLILDIWKYDGPDVYQFVREKIRPMPQEYLWALFRIVLISFIPSIVLIWLGFSMNSRWLLFIGGTWRAACTVLLLIALTPVGLIIEVVRGGSEGSGKRWAEIISGTFIGELFFTLIVMILLPRLKANLELLPLLLMSSMILGMAGGAFLGKGFIASATAIIVTAVTVAIVFPGPINRLLGGLDEANSLQHFKIDPEKLENRTVAFYGPDGSPLAWYTLVVIDKAKKIGYLELFTRSGYHPSTKEKLEPVNREITDLIFEKKASILHPLNIKKPGDQMNTQSRAAPTPENQKAPAVIPPATSPQIDLSKPWKFRWEKFPGYPGYESDRHSDWIPARIEQKGNEIKIILLGPDGSNLAIFSGERKSNGTFAGYWHMTDLSGRGNFILSRVELSSIKGTMQDETLDPRFIKISLKAL